jgi:hypothetical protein
MSHSCFPSGHRPVARLNPETLNPGVSDQASGFCSGFISDSSLSNGLTNPGFPTFSVRGPSVPCFASSSFECS